MPSLPFSLNGVTVSFDVPSAGLSLPGSLLYTSPTQVNVQVPWELQGLPSGTSVEMKVTLYEYEFGSVFTVPLANFSPSLFQYSLGSGLPLTVAATAAANTNTFFTSSNPAQKGQAISLYANGLGPVGNQPADGFPASSSSNKPSPTTGTVTVTIGGQPATVAYAGLAPGTPGLYRIDVTVPTGISSGAQTVLLSEGGQTTQSTLYIQ
jgi:uncharacterized protein (TIGR03437 family)